MNAGDVDGVKGTRMSEESYIIIPEMKCGSISIETCVCCEGRVVTRRTRKGEIESTEHYPPVVTVDIEEWRWPLFEPLLEKIKNLFKHITRRRA